MDIKLLGENLVRLSDKAIQLNQLADRYLNGVPDVILTTAQKAALVTKATALKAELNAIEVAIENAWKA